MANFNVKRLKVITLPVLKLEKNKERFFKLLTAMYQGKKIEENKEPAMLVEAIDLETGEHGLVICPTVMQKELHEAYPGDGYVSKCFSVVISRQPGKSYNHVSLSEIAEPEDGDYEPTEEKEPTAGLPQGGDTLDQQEVADAAPTPASGSAKAAKTKGKK